MNITNHYDLPEAVINHIKKKWQYNYSGNVVNGNLCKECDNNKNCKDYPCPLYKFREDIK